MVSLLYIPVEHRLEISRNIKHINKENNLWIWQNIVDPKIQNNRNFKQMTMMLQRYFFIKIPPFALKKRTCTWSNFGVVHAEP